jgi:hypothetical protein
MIRPAAARDSSLENTTSPNTFVKKQLSVIQWLHENRWEGCTTKAMDGAAANGNFEMVK